jgi:protoporphyrinogen IX oxidase
MTLIHAYIGHLINKSGETKGAYRMPSPVILLGAGLPMMAGVLWLVLAKPELGNLTNMLPTWMTEPQELLS